MAARTKGKSSFVKQAAILASAGMLVRFLGFVYRLPLTNMLGDEGNGIYGMGYYIYTFLLILSSAGLPAAISKLVSERLALRPNLFDCFGITWHDFCHFDGFDSQTDSGTGENTGQLLLYFVPLSDTDHRCHHVRVPRILPRYEYHGAHSHFSNCGTDF